VDGSIDLGGDTTLFTELYQVRAGMLIQKLQRAEKITEYFKTLKVTTSMTLCNADETSLFFNLQSSKTSLFEKIFAMVV
jgi:hypothetical protein